MMPSDSAARPTALSGREPATSRSAASSPAASPIAPPVLLRLFGFVELMIGACALATPTVLAAVHAAYIALFSHMPDSLALATLARFVMSFAVLLMPTALMGAALPIVLKSSFNGLDGVGTRVGLLYAANTGGAICGVLLAGFSLIPHIGLTRSFLLAASLNGLVGLVAVTIGYGQGFLVTRTFAASAPTRAPAAVTPSPVLDEAGSNMNHAPWAWLILAVFAISGFASLALEVIWFRVLGILLGPTSYAFTLMLAAVLAGIALGSALITPLMRWRVGWLQGLALLQIGAGLGCGLCVIAVLLAAARPGTREQDFKEWFTVTQVAEGVRRIQERGAVNFYLIEGRNRALLVDTGTGLTRVRDFVQTLTRRPLTVVLTHAHPDHAGASGQFPAVSVHDAEVDAIAFFSTPERRDFLKYMVGAPVPSALAAATTTAPSAAAPAKIERVKDGYVFELGERAVEVIASPGHTAGSICLLDRRQRLLLAGDTSSGLVWMQPPDALPLQTFARTLETLNSRANAFDTILPGHGDPVDRSFIGEQLACARAILDGTATREPYKSPFGDAMRAKYGRASIAFNPDKLWEEKSKR